MDLSIHEPLGLTPIQPTAGPWRVDIDGDGDVFVVAANGRRVHYAGNMETTDGEDHADARLIASAPDLLTACEEWVERFEEAHKTRDPRMDYETVQVYVAEVKALRQLVAAARGKMVEFVEQMPSGDGFLQGSDPGDENDFGEAVR